MQGLQVSIEQLKNYFLKRSNVLPGDDPSVPVFVKTDSDESFVKHYFNTS